MFKKIDNQRNKRTHNYFLEVKEENPAKRKEMIPSKRTRVRAPATIYEIKLKRSGRPRTLFIKSITDIIQIKSPYEIFGSERQRKEKRSK